MKRIREIPGIKPINTCIPKPWKLEPGRSPRLRIKSTQLGNNRAGSTTITPPPKLKSLSKVKAAIAKINSEPSEPIVFGTKRSITPTALPGAYKPELAKSSTSELLQGTKSRAERPVIKPENRKLRCSEVHLTRTLELRCSEVHLMHEVQ